MGDKCKVCGKSEYTNGPESHELYEISNGIVGHKFEPEPSEPVKCTCNPESHVHQSTCPLYEVYSKPSDPGSLEMPNYGPKEINAESGVPHPSEPLPKGEKETPYYRVESIGGGEFVITTPSTGGESWPFPKDTADAICEWLLDARAEVQKSRDERWNRLRKFVEKLPDVGIIELMEELEREP